MDRQACKALSRGRGMLNRFARCASMFEIPGFPFRPTEMSIGSGGARHGAQVEGARSLARPVPFRAMKTCGMQELIDASDDMTTPAGLTGCKAAVDLALWRG